MSSRYHYDVIVIGAGHAGVEAAAAAARLGARTALLTTNCDTVGQMSCNPAIGGVGKAQLVREVDALGGIMGRAIDATGIQFRVLNRSKGPAMHGPRAQADKKLYQMEVKRLVEETPGLDLRQETVEDLLFEPQPAAGPGRSAWRIRGVRVRGRCRVSGRRGRAHHRHLPPGGDAHRRGEDARRPGGGGHHLPASAARSPSAGFRIDRFKTGTPCRLAGGIDRLRPARGAAGRRRAPALLVSHRPRSARSSCPAGSPARIPRSTT